VENAQRMPNGQNVKRMPNGQNGSKVQSVPKRSMDYSILITTLILVAYGVIMVFSASYYLAESSSMYNNDGLFFFKKQIIGAVIGIIGMIGFSFFNYKYLAKLKYPLMIVALVLLAVVLIPGVGRDVNGSSRWLVIAGQNLQPSEVTKFALIVFVSATISVNKDRMNTFRFGMLPSLFVTGIVCILIYLQPNFSAIVCIFLTVLIMLFVGGVKGWHMGVLLGTGLAGGLGVMQLSDYRVDRVVSFLDPWKYADSKGYQVIQSLYAIGAGGFFGRGLGNARQKLLYLPYGQSDFIFSIIVEELGFLGAIVLIGLFAFLIYRGVKVATRAPDLFGSSLATGIIAIIAIQVCVNIAVVTSSIPPTGVSLPFISYGSSSLVIFMCMIGILLNISKQSKA
jgi:cell division protein FtsW